MAGYHKVEIPKGELGEVSKIFEELIELEDADAQGVKILALCELADLFGAIRAWAKKHGVEFPGREDIRKMSSRYVYDDSPWEGLGGRDPLPNLRRSIESFASLADNVDERPSALHQLLINLALVTSVRGVFLADLHAMAKLTSKAFKDGKR